MPFANSSVARCVVAGIVVALMLATPIAGAAYASGRAPVVAQGLPGNGQVPSSVVDADSCTSFLTNGGLDPSGSQQLCQMADQLTQLFGGSMTFNQVFSCSYAQAANLVAGGNLDRTALASCLGLPPS